MSKTVTLESFKKWFPHSKEPDIIYEAFKKYFKQYEINTTNRRAGFLAQCGHESIGFSVNSENLNYSVKGLMSIFSKYFKTEDEAKLYARQAEKIANKVYGNRMGNVELGDGYKYRGRGFIQLTGKDNYSAFAKYKNITIGQCIDYLSTIEGSVESALWFWKDRGLNRYCDNDDITGMTRKINGGTNGIVERKDYYDKIKKELGI
jgi:putative chitinase